MFIPEFDVYTVWKQTIKYYKTFPEQTSSIFRRRVDITTTEMDALQRKWRTTINAPVIQKDCIYVAIDYIDRGFNPIILNMCDWNQPGGGVDSGSFAQEEELFRRSNYHKHLSDDLYPLQMLDTTISHGVEFFRHGIDKGYVLMDKSVKIDCIGAPALSHPRLNSDSTDFEYKGDKQFMEEKIRMLLYTAAKNENDCIILSAWGCGAYGCPAKSVAKLFKSALKEFAGVFRETPFAILGPNHSIFFEEFDLI